MSPFSRGRAAAIVPAALTPLIAGIVLLRSGSHADGRDCATGVLLGIAIGIALVALIRARRMRGC